MSNMIGVRIRELRQTQGWSLADVAGKAKISVATLSRIENDKQSIDLGLFLLLAKVLQIAPSEILNDGENNGHQVSDPLARRIAGLGARDRTELWRELAAERRILRAKERGSVTRDMGSKVEELLAQVEFLREELEVVHKRMKKR